MGAPRPRTPHDRPTSHPAPQIPHHPRPLQMGMRPPRRIRPLGHVERRFLPPTPHHETPPHPPRPNPRHRAPVRHLAIQMGHRTTRNPPTLTPHSTPANPLLLRHPHPPALPQKHHAPSPRPSRRNERRGTPRTHHLRQPPAPRRHTPTRPQNVQLPAA